MGKSWDGGDVAFQCDTWKEVARVCKPGAILLAFGGTRTFHRLACAIEDAGWEIRDTICWLYGSGFPKSLDISKAIDNSAGVERKVVGASGNGRPNRAGKFSHSLAQPQTEGGSITAPATDSAKLWNGWGTALKPAWEPIIVAMKPLDGTFSENAQKHGIAGLNIDGARIHSPGSEARDYTVKRLKPGATLNKTGGNWRPEDGEEYRGTTKAGRFPANLILDEVAAEMLDEQSGDLQSGLMNPGQPRNASMGKGGYMGDFPDTCTLTGTYGDSGGASRFFYTAKASRSERGEGNDHPTVKPLDLMKYLCKLTSTPTGGKILDPFAGSGTTLVAVREMGRTCVGIELEESHCKIVIERLRQQMLFSGIPSKAGQT